MGVAASTQIRTYQSFYRSAWACAIKLHEASLTGRLLALPSSIRLVEGIKIEKYSSLLRYGIYYGSKMFYSTGPWICSSPKSKTFVRITFSVKSVI
jgi:hypothetical protein